MRENRVGGIVLIALGLFFLGLQSHLFGGEIVVSLIGACFLVPYFAGGRRQFGLLIPGSLLTFFGFGVMFAAQNIWPPANGMVIMLGFAVGFAGVHLLAPERPWWPLIPAGFFGVIAVLAGISAFPWFRLARDAMLGLVLLAAGVLLIARSRKTV